MIAVRVGEANRMPTGAAHPARLSRASNARSEVSTLFAEHGPQVPFPQKRASAVQVVSTAGLFGEVRDSGQKQTAL